MAVPKYLREAAKKGAKTTAARKTARAARAAAKAATATAAPAIGKEGILKMLGGGKGLGATFKAHPLGMGIGAYFILQMLFDRIMKHYGTARQTGAQERLIGSQMAASPEDTYYQAMLPQLSEERQSAQNALLQAIMGGGGEVPTVPGERIIGGG